MVSRVIDIQQVHQSRLDGSHDGGSRDAAMAERLGGKTLASVGERKKADDKSSLAGVIETECNRENWADKAEIERLTGQKKGFVSLSSCLALSFPGRSSLGV